MSIDRILVSLGILLLIVGGVLAAITWLWAGQIFFAHASVGCPSFCAGGRGSAILAQE